MKKGILNQEDIQSTFTNTFSGLPTHVNLPLQSDGSNCRFNFRSWGICLFDNRLFSLLRWAPISFVWRITPRFGNISICECRFSQLFLPSVLFSQSILPPKLLSRSISPPRLGISNSSNFWSPWNDSDVDFSASCLRERKSLELVYLLWNLFSADGHIP